MSGAEHSITVELEHNHDFQFGLTSQSLQNLILLVLFLGKLPIDGQEISMFDLSVSTQKTPAPRVSYLSKLSLSRRHIVLAFVQSRSQRADGFLPFRDEINQRQDFLMS